MRLTDPRTQHNLFNVLVVLAVKQCPNAIEEYAPLQRRKVGKQESLQLHIQVVTKVSTLNATVVNELHATTVIHRG